MTTVYRLLRSRQILFLTSLCVLLAGAAGSRAASVPVKTLYVSPTGSDSAPCTKAQPCLNFNRAYRAAVPGETIVVEPGSYGLQGLSADPRKVLPAVKFRFQDGASVRALGVTASNAVSFQNLQAQIVTVFGAHDVTFTGGSIGPWVDDASKVIESDRVTFDGVTFHDYTKVKPDVHMECLHAWGVTNFTVKRSRFFNCAIMDLFISNFSGPDMNEILVENNWFDPPGSHDATRRSVGFYGLSIGSVGGRSASNVRIAYNSVPGGMDLGGNGATYTNWTIVGNAGSYGQFSCFYGLGSAATYRYNVWTNARCGSTDTQADPGFLDRSNFDLRLSLGSAAIGKGDPSEHPSVDIEGNLRPRLLPPDAGADQRETAQIVLGRSIGSARLGLSRAQIEQFYGAPSRLARYRGGPRSSRIATYRIPGGRLWIVYGLAGQVMGVGTSSRYYSTSSELGVRSKVRTVSRGAAWLRCRKAYRGRAGGATIFFGAPSKSAKTIASIWILRRGYDNCLG